MQRVAAALPVTGAATRQYLRGSSLLLSGRLIAAVLNFAVQVLAVRYLAKNDYGAFAYALAVVSMGSSVIQVGLGKAIPRLIPIYVEHRDHARSFGSIVLATGTIWGLGLSLIALLYGLRGVLSGGLVSDAQSLSLLLILIALSPVTAYTTLLEKVVAVFVSARAIFWRRQVLGPGLKLVAVLVVIYSAGDVYLLAYGYLAGGVVGVLLYLGILLQQWRKQDLLRHLHPRRIKLPVRELFGFSLPLVSSQLSLVLRGTLLVILLNYFHQATAVAEYRAVLPVAGLNMLVYETFALLFIPAASRLFARKDTQGISEMYWQTSIWITVLTFPVFALTCALAEPLTVLLFGAEYAKAALLLAVLAVGHYFDAVLGFNSASLTVHGKLRFIVINDILASIVIVLLAVLLIPRYGALGAAVSMSATLILHNVFNQIALRIANTGVQLIERHFAQVYAAATLIAVALFLAQWLFEPPLYLSVAAAAVGTLLLMRIARQALNSQATFPEIMRIPFVRQLLSWS